MKAGAANRKPITALLLELVQQTEPNALLDQPVQLP